MEIWCNMIDDEFIYKYMKKLPPMRKAIIEISKTDRRVKISNSQEESKSLTNDDVIKLIGLIFFNHDILFVDDIDENLSCFKITRFEDSYSDCIFFSKKAIDFLKELNELYGELV